MRPRRHIQYDVHKCPDCNRPLAWVTSILCLDYVTRCYHCFDEWVLQVWDPFERFWLAYLECVP